MSRFFPNRTRRGRGGNRVTVASLGTNHRLYADYEYASGARLEQPWMLSMGYRYTW
ncbi:autotransporter outer membrane beta-barrel domain-containing protein [Cupriavidus basilensis]